VKSEVRYGYMSSCWTPTLSGYGTKLGGDRFSGQSFGSGTFRSAIKLATTRPEWSAGEVL
jgi:hypothetical protein